MGLVFALAWRRQLNPVVIVFAGLVINLYLAAISMGLLLFFQESSKGCWCGERISGPEQLERRRLSAATVAAGRDAGGGAGAPAGGAGAGRCQRTQPGVSLKHLRLAGLGLACSSPPAW